MFNLLQKMFHLFYFHTGESQREEIEKKGFTQKWMATVGNTWATSGTSWSQLWPHGHKVDHLVTTLTSWSQLWPLGHIWNQFVTPGNSLSRLVKPFKLKFLLKMSLVHKEKIFLKLYSLLERSDGATLGPGHSFFGSRATERKWKVFLERREKRS